MTQVFALLRNSNQLVKKKTKPTFDNFSDLNKAMNDGFNT